MMLDAIDPLATMHSLASAFEHELEAKPLEVNALVTGATFLVGDLVAQTVERMRARGQPTASVAEPDSDAADASLAVPTAAPAGVSGMRLARSFAVGCVILGPLTHFYYEWVAAHDTLDIPAKVLLDNTLFLFLDNMAYVLSLTLLGGGTHALATASMPGEDVLGLLADLAESLADELWSMQLTGWRILPAVAIFNYLFVPNGHRVLFMDGVDVIFAALLSLQHAKAVDTQVDSTEDLQREISDQALLATLIIDEAE